MRRDNIVTAADYPDLSYFSPAGESQPVAELLKAITAGTGSDSSLFTGGRSLVMESLDDTLADVLWSDKHVKLFKALRASSLGATVDEWVTRSSYGSAWGVAVGETGNPPISEADLARQIDTVSYYRSRREVSHVMTLMRSIESAEVEEEQAGTRQILGRLETDLFTGDRDVFPERVKGLLAHAVEQGGDLLRDAHGAAVNKQDLFHELAGIVYNEGGALTQVLHNPICQADIDAALQPAQRLVIPVQAADGTVRVGATQRSLATAHGDVMFDADRFVRGGWTMQAPSEAQGPDAPGTPTINSVTGNTGSIYDQTNLPAGDYYVTVTAVCETGESAAATAQAVTLVAGNVITINVTPADADNTGYRVYVSEVGAADGSDCRFHVELARDGSPQDLVVDGHWVTGSTTMHLLSADPSEDAIDWRQLLPMMRMDLAITGPVIPFLLNLYGYMRVKKPNFHCAIKNVIPTPVLDGGWNPLGA